MNVEEHLYVSDVRDDCAKWRKRAEKAEDELKEMKARAEKAEAIVADCMKAMPCGNITTHTPENLADRIRDMVKELTIYDIDLDRAEAKIKKLTLQLST